MSFTDLHNSVPALATAVPSAVVGALLEPHLVERGLCQLHVAVDHPRLRRWSLLAGATAGVSAVLVVRHGGSWWLLPAALVWAYSLLAAAVCDGFTQRVPTALVRQGTVATGVLVVAASAATTHWRWAILGAAGAAGAGVVFAFCWRFLGAGYGDVRIAVLGGVGLVYSTRLGIAAAVGAFIVITLSQAGTVLKRGGNRHTLFPYGPAIAAAFIVAAVL